MIPDLQPGRKPVRAPSAPTAQIGRRQTVAAQPDAVAVAL